MKPVAIVGACIGGLIGALIWAGITYAFEYEIGYMALAVGALVGFGAVVCGGSGEAVAGCCSVIAVVSILGGKVLAISMFMGNSLSSEFYALLEPDAEAYAEVRTDWDTRRFMVEMGYTEAESAGGVSQEEIQNFKDSFGPVLEDMAENKPGLKEWRDSETAQTFLAGMEDQMEVSSLDVLKSSFNIIDIIFFVLGIVTAYRVALHNGHANTVEEV